MLPLAEGSAIGFHAGSGSLIGLPAAFTGEPYSTTAVALTKLEMAVMEPDKFCRMVESSPLISLEVLRILAGETRAVRLAIQALG